jgi:hypothetical protein
MRTSVWLGRALWAAAVVVVLGLAGPAWGADKKAKGRRGGDKGPSTVEIKVDLSKLPPDLARRLLDHVAAQGGKKAGKAKASPGGRQAEQTGQHKDKGKKAKKGKKKSKAGPGGRQGEQTGQHEDQD